MTDDLRDAAFWSATGSASFESTLSERWANGPGAYGGVVAASLLHQMGRVLDDGSQVPRTLTVHMNAPVRFEPARMYVEVRRRGMTISNVTARIEQSDETRAFASATFAGEQSNPPEFFRLDRPEVPPPDEVEVVSETPMLPRFACEFFEYQYCLGEYPMSGAETPESGGWLSSEEPVRDGPLLATCLLDAWPPSVFSTFETFRRTVTVDMRLQFWSAAERSGPTDEPFLFHARSDVVRDGYAEEDALLWSREGDLVARSKQLYAVLD